MKDISTTYLEAKRRISEIINEVDCHLIPTYKRNMEDLETLLGDVKKQSRELEQTVVKQSQKLKDFIQSIEIELLQRFVLRGQVMVIKSIQKKMISKVAFRICKHFMLH